jgi:hypothetical protein
MKFAVMFLMTQVRILARCTRTHHLLPRLHRFFCALSASNRFLLALNRTRIVSNSSTRSYKAQIKRDFGNGRPLATCKCMCIVYILFLS